MLQATEFLGLELNALFQFLRPRFDVCFDRASPTRLSDTVPWGWPQTEQRPSARVVDFRAAGALGKLHTAEDGPSGLGSLLACGQ